MVFYKGAISLADFEEMSWPKILQYNEYTHRMDKEYNKAINNTKRR